MNQTYPTDFSTPLWETDTLRGIRSRRLGLYIHLPYCRTKCTYCAFVSAPPQTEAEMDAYTEAVRLHLISGAQHIKNRPVSTVFFGGGTPSLLGAKRLSILLQCIRQQFNILPDAEITVEANPESVTSILMESLALQGVNRISMGAQSFDEDELKQIGRVHLAGDIFNAVQHTQRAGIQNVSIDLIYGLPNQSLKKWRESVRRALDCGVRHLSAYGLTYEEGTLLHRQMTQGSVTPLTDEKYVVMYHHLQEALAAFGLQHYEISNGCLPGYECRHNLIYWKRDEYLAFGVSAHGMVDGWRYRIHPSPKRYIEFFQHPVQQDYLEMAIVSEKQRLTAKESAEDVMIFGLRLCRGVALADFSARFGYSPFQRWGKEIQEFMDRGWLEQTEGHLRLTPQTYLLSNEVLQAFVV